MEVLVLGTRITNCNERNWIETDNKRCANKTLAQEGFCESRISEGGARM